MSRHVHQVTAADAIALLTESEASVTLVIDANGDAPAPKGMRREKSRVLEDIFAACVALTERRLDERKYQKDVVVLLRDYFETPHKVREDLRAAVIRENPAPDGWESESLPVAINEARLHAMREIDEMTFDIPEIPKERLLSDKHMPKLMQKEMGDQNQWGVGDIMRKLHWVFTELPRAEKPLVDGQDGTDKET